MPAKLAMSANDLRQCLRIAGGGTLGFFVCKLMNWDYGSFFGVYLMLLLGLTPVINLHIVRQFLANSVVISVEVLVLYGLFGDRPLLMTPIVFGLFVYRFALMARGPLFFFGALSSVFLSMLLHFASYPDVDLFDMLASNMVATWLTVAIAVLMFYLFPDVEPRPPRQAPAKDAPSRRHETLLGATVATLSFVVFQTFDLKDSLSAQIASILVLFPMHWKGVHFAGASAPSVRCSAVRWRWACRCCSTITTTSCPSSPCCCGSRRCSARASTCWRTACRGSVSAR